MKKTIIALMALAGVAMGTQLEQLWSVDFQATAPKLTTATGITMAHLPDSSELTGKVCNSGTYFAIEQTAGKLTLNDAFLYEVTVTPPSATFSSWPVLVSVGSDDNVHFKGSYYKANDCFVLDVSDKTKFVTKGVTVDDSTKSDGSLSMDTTAAAITLSFLNDGKGTMSMYVDDEFAGSVSFTGNDLSVLEIDRFGFGFGLGGHQGNNRCELTVLNAGMYKVIPEPTTATLSLLALAGLAARRRRK